MPFRERAKNLFKGRNRDDSQSSSERKDSNSTHRVYKPGEEMPPPKYRRPPQKEHKDKLEAFSFSDAWRRRSFQSLHSPMGTRASSRRQSTRSLHKSAVGRKSMTRAREDGAANLAVGGDTEEGNAVQNDSVNETSVPTRPVEAVESEEEVDEDGVLTGPLSYVESKDTASRLSRPRTREDTLPNGHPNGLHKTMSTARDHQPFSEQDIANAMRRSKMEVSALS